ncbi:putative hydrolase of the HAD superfamily [Stackebrandtia albiflava]|uniref:Putative hydrolase of the HAD superfamily n=1 Tax=Stackebrandtia albiflava TaxID=406432 RepID=A0A562V1X0_9ACTN|nr:HAD-IA family hydrolase [Stackebrandtia albiflava]TWJ11851.1 putative hydrolase of the HAD superfamily [Stackebrandtia albiflava]
MSPRLALFDLDNTLVDRAAAHRRWVERLVADHGLGPGAVEWLIAEDGDGLTPKDRYFAAVKTRFDLRESTEELWARYRTEKPALITPDPTIRAGLTRLRERGWRIGIVTNGREDTQVATIMHAGLSGLVDGWAVSGAEGIRKPATELFAIAASRCGADLSLGGWMIGDSAEADVGGGRAAGLRTIWIDRGRIWRGGDAPNRIRPDATAAIESLLAET